METTLSSSTKDWLTGRRLRAWQLHQQGWTQQNIAHALGVTQGAVSQWITRAKKDGTQALQKRTATGAPPRLSWEQRAKIPHLLERGPEAFGFCGAVWTSERIATVVERELHVRYHQSHVCRLLNACGWSRQKPVCRATQRNEEAIEEWHQKRLPELKKGQKQASINSCL